MPLSKIHIKAPGVARVRWFGGTWAGRFGLKKSCNMGLSFIFNGRYL
jgi:hypothetical protein